MLISIALSVRSFEVYARAVTSPPSHGNGRHRSKSLDHSKLEVFESYFKTSGCLFSHRTGNSVRSFKLDYFPRHFLLDPSSRHFPLNISGPLNRASGQRASGHLIYKRKYVGSLQLVVQTIYFPVLTHCQTGNRVTNVRTRLQLYHFDSLQHIIQRIH
jgi:hypothetical protein